MITAKIISDSLSPHGIRLTTFELCYPRFIHSEFMTHRVFSRNSASSRAIPVKKMMAYIRENPAMPVYWGKNQPGMSASTELDSFEKARAIQIWMEACQSALRYAEDFLNLGVHKQVANRILEPFVHMQTIVTATEWGNYFNLRCHKDAQPEIKVLAEVMRAEYETHVYRPLFFGEWHLPYVGMDEVGQCSIEDVKKYCVARCCRVSYMNHDGTDPDPQKDISLHDKLIYDGHMSPLEHAATPLKDRNEWSGNFRGWKQYRKEIPGEAIFRGSA